ncbi:MAG: hypothetical protein ACREQ4_04430 [Candidatus Binataceae bacterium]
MSDILRLPPPKRRTRKTRMRDQRSERAARRLRKEYAVLDQVPAVVVRNFAALNVRASEIAARLQIEGIVRANGDPNPLLETFRRFKLAELAYARALGITFEWGKGGETLDLPSAMIKAAEQEDDEKEN